eukprot:2780910-Rhodomonas_salina.1
MASCFAMASPSTVPSDRSTATAVSSQDVSIPSTVNARSASGSPDRAMSPSDSAAGPPGRGTAFGMPWFFRPRFSGGFAVLHLSSSSPCLRRIPVPWHPRRAACVGIDTWGLQGSRMQRLEGDRTKAFATRLSAKTPKTTVMTVTARQNFSHPATANLPLLGISQLRQNRKRGPCIIICNRL